MWNAVIFVLADCEGLATARIWETITTLPPRSGAAASARESPGGFAHIGGKGSRGPSKSGDSEGIIGSWGLWLRMRGLLNSEMMKKTQGLRFKV